MSTQRIHKVGSAWSNITLLDGWGELTDEQIDVLVGEIRNRWAERLPYVTWCPSTSELIAPVEYDFDIESLDSIRQEIVDAVFRDQQAIIEAAGLEY